MNQICLWLCNKENNVFKDGIGVKGLRFKLHGYNHGNHQCNHRNIWEKYILPSTWTTNIMHHIFSPLSVQNNAKDMHSTILDRVKLLCCFRISMRKFVSDPGRCVPCFPQKYSSGTVLLCSKDIRELSLITCKMDIWWLSLITLTLFSIFLLLIKY